MARKRGRKKALFKMRLRIETVYSLASIAFFALAILLAISFTNKGSLLFPIQTTLRELFGAAAYLVPFLFLSSGLILTGVKWSFAKPQVLFGAVLLLLSSAALGESGSIGVQLFSEMSTLIQPIGAYAFFSAVFIAGLLILTDTSIREVYHYIKSAFELYSEDKLHTIGLKKIEMRAQQQLKEDGGFKIRGGQQSQQTQKQADSQKTSQPVITKKTVPASTSDFPTQVLANAPGEQEVWQYPPISLLSPKAGGHADRGDVKQNASTIEKTLESFGIKAKVREVNLGPAVTQYALEISLGTKLSKITSLANDLALALAAPTGQIRIEAPIPGRSLVGIEIPNRSPEFVTMRTILTSDAVKKIKSKIAVGLGLNVSGESVVADIARMPHVLIAGATGSGKSVAINSFLATMLFRASPNEVKLILVDPKRVELTGYNDIPHLLTPVIVEPQKVIAALKWAMGEMDRRYKVFAEVGVRNIEGYNELAGFQAMPYIIIVIDELADIMLFSPAEVEDSITRIAQMARATGMHLVLATQRPSVDVITGLIKANIPARIAFNVSSMMDSRVILDMPGAEKLLGRGDMLYIPPDQAKPTRIQGTFISDAEIHTLIQFLKQTGAQPQYQEEVTTKFHSTKVASGSGTGGDVDELFGEAVKTVVEYDRASASVLQRKFSIGYNRAARIIDQLFEMNIVGPPEGSKPREVNQEAAREYLERKGV